MALFKFDVVGYGKTEFMRWFSNDKITNGESVLCTVQTNKGDVKMMLSKGVHDGSNGRFILFNSDNIPITFESFITCSRGPVFKIMCGDGGKNVKKLVNKYNIPWFKSYMNDDQFMTYVLRRLTGFTDLELL